MLPLWTPAYVAIGSNLGDPLKNVRDSFAQLAALRSSRLIARSRFYLTAPLGPQDQPHFVNAAAGLLTLLNASELLSELKRVEQSLGRATPIVRWGPRIIDFDLSVFGTEQLTTDRLTLPHPGVPVRNFVLYPLQDIAPDLDVPGHGRVRELVARVSAEGLSVIEPTA